MSNLHCGLAWKLNIPSTPKFVLLALADCTNHLTNACFPSQGYLGKMTGLSRETINRAIRWLTSNGYVTSNHVFDDEGRQRRNTYTLNLTTLCDARSQVGVTDDHTGSVTDDHTEPGIEEPGIRNQEVPPYNGSTVDLLSQDATSPSNRDFAYYVANPHMIGADGAFETFWAQCPKKVGKKDALKAWRTVITSGEKPVDITTSMSYYRLWVERNSKPPQFVLNPATWLRQARWNDELKDDGNDKRPEYKNVKARLFEKWWPELAENPDAGNQNTKRGNGSGSGGATFDLLGCFRALPGPDDEGHSA